jgi:hypothetical protein
MSWNRNFSKVGTVKNIYGSTTLRVTQKSRKKFDRSKKLQSQILAGWLKKQKLNEVEIFFTSMSYTVCVVLVKITTTKSWTNANTKPEKGRVLCLAATQCSSGTDCGEY